MNSYALTKKWFESLAVMAENTMDGHVYDLASLDWNDKIIDRTSYKGRGRPRKKDYLYFDKIKNVYRKPYS